MPKKRGLCSKEYFITRQLLPSFLVFLHTEELNEPIITKIKLQKLFYLAEKEFHINLPYIFQDCLRGPFNESIEWDALACQQKGFLTIETKTSSLDRKYWIYNNTSVGKEYWKNFLIEKKIPQSEVKKWRTLIKEFGKFDYKELLDIVYTKHYLEYSKLDENIANLRNDINSLMDIFKNKLDIESYDKLRILQYMRALWKQISEKQKNIQKSDLNIIFSASIDLIKNIKEPILKEENLDQDGINIYEFIEEKSVDLNILPSITEEYFNADIFLEENEKQCLLKILS